MFSLKMLISVPAENKLISEGLIFFIIIFNEDILLNLKPFFFRLQNMFLVNVGQISFSSAQGHSSPWPIGAGQEELGGRARGRRCGWDRALGGLRCPSAGHGATVGTCWQPWGVHPKRTRTHGRFWGLIGVWEVLPWGKKSWKTVGFILSAWKQILKKLWSRSSLSETYGDFSSRVIY